MALNEMRITDSGLLNVNRKIIGSRKYDTNLISNIGNVSIFESIASGFDISSYLCASELSFLKDDLTITCTATFAQSPTDQLVYLLKGDEHSIELHFCDEQSRLIVDNVVVLQFSYLKLEEGMKIQTLIKISKTKCTYTLNVHDLIFEKSISFNSSIIQNLTDLYIGNEPYELGNFWKGSIDLSTFTISQGEEIAYTPSSNCPLSFSKILISDGEFKLNDKSKAIANHIYEYPVSEITRSGSNVLLTTQVNDDAKLLIKEIGLYAITADGEILFSSISNLSVNKGKGVPYDLILTLNTYLGFINVVGFPDLNSFKINEPDLCLFGNFQTVKELMLYVFTNLERIIAMNALDIGYNRAQVFYRLQKEITENEDCYFTIENFVKLSKKLKRITDVSFNPDSVSLHGNIVVNKDGIVNNFSTTDYISGNILFDNTNNWEISFNFKVIEKVSGTLITLRGPSPIQPLLFQANYSSQEDKIYFYALLGKNGTDDEYIVDANLFEIKTNVNYFIKFRYIHNPLNTEDSYYQLLLSDDGESYHEVFTKYSPRIILPVRGFSIGVESNYNSTTRTFDISNPLKGTFYVNSLNIIANSELWNPTTETIINPTQLLQYYHIPDLNKSRYTVKDMCNLNEFSLTITENSILGDRNLIDFSDIDGFSLCMKVDLHDRNDKILLAKTNLINKPYFLLALFNETLYFYLFTRTKTIILSKVITDREFPSYLSKPALLTVIMKDNKLTLYKDTKELTSFQGVFGTFRSYQHAFLANYIQTDALIDICSNLELQMPVEDYVEMVEEHQGRYIKDIVVVEGPLKPDEIYYINMLLNE